MTVTTWPRGPIDVLNAGTCTRCNRHTTLNL